MQACMKALFWKQRYAGGCAAELRPGAAPAGKVTLSLLGAVATHSNMLFAYFSPLCSFNLVYFSHSKIPAYWTLIWNLVNVGCSVFWDLFSKSPFFAVQSYSFAWSKWRNQKYWSNLKLAESRNLFFIRIVKAALKKEFQMKTRMCGFWSCAVLWNMIILSSSN